MGRRLKFLLQWALCAAVVFLAFLGSKGSVLFLSRKLSRPSNKLTFVRRAVLPGIDLAPSPATASILPPNKERASSPANHMNAQIAPPPSPATPLVGPVTNSPSVLPPKFEDAPPPIQSSVPPIQDISPSNGANVEHKQPRTIAPSVESQAPNIPIGAAHELSPSTMILPPLGQNGSHKSGAHAEAPNTNVSVTSPLAPDSSPPEKNQSTRPNMQPISAAVPPSMTPPSSHTRISNSPATSPMVNASHNFLAAPPKGTTGDNSSEHHSRIIGLSPASSPLLHKANKPSNGSQSPSLPSSEPPRREEHHNPAPAPISPINQGTASRRAQQHMLSPSSPAPFFPRPQTPAENITQNPAPAPTVPIHDGRVHKGVGNQSLAPSLSPAHVGEVHKAGNISLALSPSPAHVGEVHKVGNTSLSPSPSPIHTKGVHKGVGKPSLAPSPSPSPSSQGGVQKGVGNQPLAPAPSSSSSNNLGPAVSPSPSHHVEVFPMGPSPSPLQAPVSSGEIQGNSTPSSSMAMPPHGWGPNRSPAPSPSNSFPPKPMTARPQPARALPPPPPNLDCTALICTEPLTNSPPGSPCTCVLPIKVELRLSVALYTFFPLVSELAQEIAYGIFMKQSQVRIMGANAASEEPDKTIVLIDLVPLGDTFDYNTALLTYTRFWHKQVVIKSSYFGDYDVLYVIYPGLPPSPPIAPASINVADGSFTNNNNARVIKPLGVDVRKQKHGLSGSSVAIIVLSSIIALVLCGGAACLLLLKHKDHTRPRAPTPQTLLPSFDNKSAGIGPTVYGSRPSSASGSFASGIATYTRSAKTFSLAEIERATNRFDDSSIIGEGGFGRVYQGTLEDGTQVAVKVLKRDDQQGGREFLAEVEMLSRLHHRNLVKLIGICTEEHLRCLVYELIPNGSVESHLHGVDKDSAPLDWNARMKIALGAARGLAYLHEDSSPRVIHRDFKSSNILLEHDFTPKVSDFGLARTALEEGNEHISTRVMGTFGYVAPEYAMTGHLLVKSDVYSYGVVLLELLTGRKPVDMSQPPGQENLVTWARPLLTSKEGLEIIIDPAVATDASSDSLAKVAAIASMCVQPEVSHRPFMGEVVQALKLVCNEGDEHGGSGSCSQEVLSAHEKELGVGAGFSLEAERGLSASEMFNASARFTREGSGSFRRHSSSGPLRPSRSSTSFWHKVRDLSAGSLSDHAVAIRQVTGQWH